MTKPTMLLRLAVLVVALSGSGCNVLDVSDPIAIEDRDIKNAQGAELTRSQTIYGFQGAFSRMAEYAAELTDEFFIDPRQRDLQGVSWEWMTEVDRRSSGFVYEASSYSKWQEIRLSATRAIEWLHAYVASEEARNRIGQMYAFRGYDILMLAEDFCPGLPLNEVEDQRVIYGPPLSTDELFERAVADFDSALVYGSDTSQVLHFAQVGKARALIGLGRFDDAATAAAPVPTGFEVLDEHEGDDAPSNSLSLTQFSSNRGSVADGEGGTGLDFASADDPRVPLISKGMATDGVTPMYGPAKYKTDAAPIVIASGIEARLIEAEAALQAGDPDWLTMLNALRTDGTQDDSGVYNPGTGGVAGLAPLADPGTEAGRVDLLFRERAFWLFATGHRLGDLRRLMRLYGRDAESVFPTGAYRIDGVAYESLTSFPFPVETESRGNPAVTGCTGP